MALLALVTFGTVESTFAADRDHHREHRHRDRGHGRHRDHDRR